MYYEEFKDTPTPQNCQAAEQTGHTAADNILPILKRTEKKVYSVIIRALWFQLVHHMGLHI